MSPTPGLIPIVLLACCLLVAGCASTDDETVVVDPNAPDVSRGTEEIVPAAPAAEPSLLDPNRIVARVNDQIITVRSLFARYGPALRQLGDAGEEQIRVVLDQFTLRYLSQVLVLEAAKRLNITVTPEQVERQIATLDEKMQKERGTTLNEDLEAQGVSRWEFEDEIKRDLITERLRAMLIGRASPVSAETRAIVDVWVRPVDIRNFYDRHLEDFRVPEAAEVDAIYIRHSFFSAGAANSIDAREKAKAASVDVVRRAREGEDMLTLMKPYHGEPVPMFAKPFPRGVNQAPVEKFVWSPETEVGQVSEPIPFPSGYLVVKLKLRQEEGVRPFEEVREMIERVLQGEKIALARMQVELELLRESVVVPRRFKTQLELRYTQEIRQRIQAIAK